MRKIKTIHPSIARCIRQHRASLLLSLMGGILGCGFILAACSSDTPEPKVEPAREGAPVELTSYVTDYAEAAPSTRAWTEPSGFTLLPELAEKSISVFFTQNGESPEEEFFFRSSGKWRVSKTDLEAETYYLYGYTPHEASVNASISSSATPADNSSYSSGAVLTLENLPAITPNDFCVIVGAKDGINADDDNGLTLGQFAYAAQPTEAVGETPKGNNYVYLLFDHLYAALRIRMKVHGEYDHLRTIKLKELRLATKAGSVATTKKATATITLAKTTDDTNPISSVVFTPTGTEKADGTVFQDDEGMTLTTTPSTYMGHFMPQGVTTLVLTCVYDVYDKNGTGGIGNLVRQDCKATNTIILSELATGQTDARRGYRYTINLTIRPTYLYVLSEPDLNNPTVEVDI